MYKLHDIRKEVGTFTFRIDGCHLERGAIYAIAGPNGCGKSTLLDLLSLLEEPTAGTMVLDGTTVDYSRAQDLLESRRRIAYLMQNPYLFNMSVRENVAYGLKVRDIPKELVREKTDLAMQRLMISDLADRPAHELSGGEAQRVALARTIVIDADVYLFDEPTANVDHQNVHVIEELIAGLNKESNATIVLSTHSRNQAYRMTTNQLSIIDGAIRDIAYENVFSGILSKADDDTRSLTLKENVTIKTGQGCPGQVTVAIDPGDIILSKKEVHSSALNRFSGPITKVEDFNGSLRVYIDTGVPLCALITRESFMDMNLNIGKQVWVTFKANAVKVI